MKIRETIQEKIEEREVIVGVRCDICNGNMATDEYSNSEIKSLEHRKEGFLNRRYSNRAKATIEYQEGFSYPDCGSLTKQEWDICPDCFYLKVVPFLKFIKPDIEPTTTESDW